MLIELELSLAHYGNQEPMLQWHFWELGWQGFKCLLALTKFQMLTFLLRLNSWRKDRNSRHVTGNIFFGISFPFYHCVNDLFPIQIWENYVEGEEVSTGPVVERKQKEELKVK